MIFSSKILISAIYAITTNAISTSCIDMNTLPLEERTKNNYCALNFAS
jgi:hypothetical protein